MTGVTSSTADGSYKLGESISISVAFSESVIADTTHGTPTLELETGLTNRLATYSSGSGSSTLVFSYTVQDGDTASDLDYTSTSALSLNSGTIKDADGNAATLTLASPGAFGSLASNSALVIDTTPVCDPNASLPPLPSFTEDMTIRDNVRDYLDSIKDNNTAIEYARCILNTVFN